MNWLYNLFGIDADPSVQGLSSPPELLEVQKALTSIDPQQAPYVACLALHAARLAGADLKISQGEKNRIAHVLQKQTQITATEANAAAEIASNLELSDKIEHYRIAELTNKIATVEQKKELIRALFYVACDEDISELESEKIRAISSALLISDAEYIQIRSEFSQHRSLLKR